MPAETLRQVTPTVLNRSLQCFEQLRGGGNQSGVSLNDIGIRFSLPAPASVRCFRTPTIGNYKVGAIVIVRPINVDFRAASSAGAIRANQPRSRCVPHHRTAHANFQIVFMPPSRLAPAIGASAATTCMSWRALRDVA